MTAGIKATKLLDEKLCWKEWMARGSLQEVSRYLESQGSINPNTGRAFTGAGIEKAAFRWVLMNQEEAREDLAYSWGRVKVVDSEGQLVSKILTDEDWTEFLIQKAGIAYYATPIKLRKYLVKHGLA